MERKKVLPWPQGVSHFRILPVQVGDTTQYFFPQFFGDRDGQLYATFEPTPHTRKRQNGEFAHTHIAITLPRDGAEVEIRSFSRSMMCALRAKLFGRFQIEPTPLEPGTIIGDQHLPDIEGAFRWCEITVDRHGFGLDTAYHVEIQHVPTDLGEQIKQTAFDAGIHRYAP